MGIVVSETEESNGFYSEMVPPSFLYEDFNMDAIQRFMDGQKKKVKEYADPNGPYKDGDLSFRHIPNAFLIADDCMADKKLWKTKLIRDIFLNGRHRKVFFLMAVQYMMDMSVDLRANVDYVFVLMEDSIKNKERLWQQFFSIFPTFDMFCQVMDQCTENYGCMVLDRTIKSTRIEDKVFYYKAQPRPPFRLGCWQFWEYDRLRSIERNPRPEEEEEGISDALEAVQGKRSGNKPIITVVREAPPESNYGAPNYGYAAPQNGYGW